MYLFKRSNVNRCKQCGNEILGEGKHSSPVIGFRSFSEPVPFSYGLHKCFFSCFFFFFFFPLPRQVGHDGIELAGVGYFPSSGLRL